MFRINYQVFRFVGSKSESLFLQRKNPRKISWTQVYRRMHKKGITEEVAKKRTRRTVKHQRAVVGASWDIIRAKRTQYVEDFTLFRVIEWGYLIRESDIGNPSSVKPLVKPLFVRAW